MKDSTGSSDRRRFWLGVKSLLASVYFGLMFFVLAPTGLLYLARKEAPFATAGTASVVIGAAIIVVATAVVGSLVRDFIRFGDGTHVPIDPPRNFVSASAYRRLRNPMYLAYVLTILGEAMVFGSGVLAVYGFVLWVIAHAYVVLREEPLLVKRFGTEYESYRENVPRWGLCTPNRKKT